MSLLTLDPLSAADSGRADPELVILLHGLSRTPRSMTRLERALASDGYEVVNLGYPANRQPIENLATYLGATLKQSGVAANRRVHFVTHSLGGVVVRYYLQTAPPLNVGRVVMLSPPNRGSELIDFMSRVPLVRTHMGPSRSQLGTGPESVPGRLGAVEFELGVITGDRSFNPVFSWLIPGPDDGMVSVERSKVEGMADFLVLPHTHTFIMRSQEVIAQTLTFLRNGRFEHDVSQPASGREDGGT